MNKVILAEPQWYRKIRAAVRMRAGNVFLIDGNIDDLFQWPQDEHTKTGKWSKTGTDLKPYPFREFLVRAMLRTHGAVCYYSMSTGLQIHEYRDDLPNISINPFTAGDSKSSLDLNIADGNHVQPNGVPNSPDFIRIIIHQVFQKIDEIIRIPWKDTEKAVAVVIDGFDRLGDDGRYEGQRYIYERVYSWGLDPEISNVNAVILCLVSDRSKLPGLFTSDSPSLKNISVDFPTTERRAAFIDFLKNKIKSENISFLDEEVNTKRFIINTRGYRLTDCRDFILGHIEAGIDKDIASLNYGEIHETSVVNDKSFFKRLLRSKKEVIRSTSEGLLEPIDSNISWDNIGGCDGPIEYFKSIADSLNEKEKDPRKNELIPKAVLLAGPPGTGKTLLAKALANELGFALVKMGDIRSMWVGESERNLSKVFRLLQAMEPVIVFIDEIDQAIGSRSSTSDGSGVNARLFGKILEFMGDNQNRGKVLWVAATNRADFLDDAMLRRFDRIIPVLLPGSITQWVQTLSGILHQLKVKFDPGMVQKFIETKIDILRQNHSGSSMEVVSRSALELMQIENKNELSIEHLEAAFSDFKTNFNLAQYQLQTLLSVASCNRLNFIPKPGENGFSYGSEEIDKAVLAAINASNNLPLRQSIQKLSTQGYLG